MLIPSANTKQSEAMKIVNFSYLIFHAFWLVVLNFTLTFSVWAEPEACGTPTTVSLYAGQSIEAGTVTASNDLENLYIRYTTANSWTLVESHLAVVPLPEQLPQNKSGNPEVGHFPYSAVHSSTVEHIYTIPISDISSVISTFYMAAHADVQLLNESGTVVQKEGAWADGEPFPGKSWATYFAYSLQPCKLRLQNVRPSAALPGEVVTLYLEGGSPTADTDVFLAGQEIPAIWASTDTMDTVSTAEFTVPEDARSGPLFLTQGNVSSNAVWFSVSNISVESPLAEDVVLDELGLPVAVNLLLVSIAPEHATYAEAERLAAIVNATIVGRVSLANAYQFRLPTASLLELRAAVALLEAEPVVTAVLENRPRGNLAVDWATDKGLDGQRHSNRVVEGADLYNQKSAADAFLPLFTAIGVIETGVDFDAGDFDGYGENSTSRSNNIGIYSKDTDFYSRWYQNKCDLEVVEHGTTVSGLVAAEIGDGGTERGMNAGLLAGLDENAHGGFNILVDNDYKDKEIEWAHGAFASSQRALEAGASVLNWSFAIHKIGAARSNCEALTVDTTCSTRDHAYSETYFNAYQNTASQFLKNVETEYPRAVVVAAAANSDTPVVKETALWAIDSPSLIVVGSHDYGDDGETGIEKIGYSNYGSKVDISAAGRVKQSDGTEGQGTSYAAPLVTATVAVMQSINPDLTPADIRRMLRSSALPIPNNVVKQNRDCWAKDDVVTAPLSDGGGNGARLNVEGAVQTAIESLSSKTVPQGDKIEVDLPLLSGDVVKEIAVTVPEEVFDKVDILFLVDVSGSYGNDINQFKAQAVELVNAFQGAGRNVQVGLATFSDFPISPYGSVYSGDYAYQLEQPLTEDPSAVIGAINGITLHGGSDGPESQLEALYQVTTGEGRIIADHPEANIAPSDVGWRDGSFRLIFLATDAGFHNADVEAAYPGSGWIDTVSQLTGSKIRVYGLQSGGNITDVVNIVSETGGETFVLSRDSSEIVDAVVAALDGASSKVDIELVTIGDFAGLIKSITNNEGGDPTYTDVAPGETRIFNVTFSRGWFSRDPTADHVFSLRLQIVAEDVAVILEYPVIVHVKLR